ncbi:MAG: hypothetical protein ACTHKB_08260 [Burkholderiaceae bacterium]
MDNITTSHALKTSIWMKPLNHETVEPCNWRAGGFPDSGSRRAMASAFLDPCRGAEALGDAISIRRFACRFTISLWKFKEFVKIMAMKSGSHNP